jgi:hypothetical protein
MIGMTVLEDMVKNRRLCRSRIGDYTLIVGNGAIRVGLQPCELSMAPTNSERKRRTSTSIVWDIIVLHGRQEQTLN